MNAQDNQPTKNKDQDNQHNETMEVTNKHRYDEQTNKNSYLRKESNVPQEKPTFEL